MFHGLTDAIRKSRNLPKALCNLRDSLSGKLQTIQQSRIHSVVFPVFQILRYVGCKDLFLSFTQIICRCLQRLVFLFCSSFCNTYFGIAGIFFPVLKVPTFLPRLSKTKDLYQNHLIGFTSVSSTGTLSTCWQRNPTAILRSLKASLSAR